MAEVVVLVAEVVTNIKADYKKSAFCVKKTPRYAGEFKKGYAYEWTKKLPLIKIELLSDNNKIKSNGDH